MPTPETRYAKAPDGTSIAYQVIGDGSVDLGVRHRHLVQRRGDVGAAALDSFPEAPG
jgi:hypothetical protein